MNTPTFKQKRAASHADYALPRPAPQPPGFLGFPSAFRGAQPPPCRGRGRGRRGAGARDPPSTGHPCPSDEPRGRQRGGVPGGADTPPHGSRCGTLPTGGRVAASSPGGWGWPPLGAACASVQAFPALLPADHRLPVNRNSLGATATICLIRYKNVSMFHLPFSFNSRMFIGSLLRTSHRARLWRTRGREAPQRAGNPRARIDLLAGARSAKSLPMPNEGTAEPAPGETRGQVPGGSAATCSSSDQCIPYVTCISA